MLPHAQGQWEPCPFSGDPRLLGSQRGATLPEDTSTRCSPCRCWAGGRPRLLTMQCAAPAVSYSRALPITAAAPLAWQVLRSHSLQRLHPALSSPRAWLCDGGTILPLSALTPTFWEGQSGLGALSQPPQWALCGVTVLGIKSELCLHSQEM